MLIHKVKESLTLVICAIDLRHIHEMTQKRLCYVLCKQIRSLRYIQQSYSHKWPFCANDNSTYICKELVHISHKVSIRWIYTYWNQKTFLPFDPEMKRYISQYHSIHLIKDHKKGKISYLFEVVVPSHVT